VFAASADVFGLVIAGEAAPVPVPEPLVGVEVVGVAGAAGSVVNGVGCGGNGFVITVAIKSLSPTSDWL